MHISNIARECVKKRKRRIQQIQGQGQFSLAFAVPGQEEGPAYRRKPLSTEAAFVEHLPYATLYSKHFPCFNSSSSLNTCYWGHCMEGKVRHRQTMQLESGSARIPTQEARSEPCA